MHKGFKDLNCWKEGRKLRIAISDVVRKFPPIEKFQLQSQMVRASRSVTANIAEGHGRFTYTDTRRFFIIARGSVTELMDHVITALDEGYISDEVLKELEMQCDTVIRLLNGYIAYLDRSNNNRTSLVEDNVEGIYSGYNTSSRKEDSVDMQIESEDLVKLYASR